MGYFYIRSMFGGLVDAAERTTKIRRPGAGPTLVAFSRAEINALSAYGVGYPLEEATPSEQAAFESGLGKIRARRTDGKESAP